MHWLCTYCVRGLVIVPLGKYNLVEMQKSQNGLAVKLRYQSMLLLIQPLE
ncbi:hypothetical protein VC87395_000223 [Vibrio paracholerae 87395]|nr:hypothetical protein VC87395_000223 [Vibrio paracholerae 87395]